jgi:hypothetical protein
MMVSIIYRGSKSAIFRNRISVVRAETDFLPDYLVCQRDIFHPTLLKKSQTLTDDVDYLTCTLSYDGNFSL